VTRYFLLSVALIVASAATAALARAQLQAPTSADSLRSALACGGKVISGIDVRPQPPYYTGLTGQWRRIARTLDQLHTTTREHVVRTFLAFKVGDKCLPLALTESERTLRAQPFIAVARVTAYDDGNGGVRIDVFTVDEVSFIGLVAAKNVWPLVYRVRLGEGNLDGQGMRLAGEWDYYQFYRDRYQGEFEDYDFLGRPYRFYTEAERDKLGGQWVIATSHPFLTELQRFGWTIAGGAQRSYFSFLTPTAPNNTELPSLDFTRDFAVVGGVGKVGQPHEAGLFGLTLSRERESVSGRPVIVADSGLMPVPIPPPPMPGDTTTSPYQSVYQTLTNRYGQHQSTRLNFLTGFQAIRYLRVTGFDALSGEQDLPVGLQVGGLFGRSLSVLGSRENDILLASSLFTGWGGRRWYAGLQVQGEGRHSESPEPVQITPWDGILASGRAAFYWKPFYNQTFIIDEEYSLGTRMRIPFQLSFADLRGGVWGYANSLLAGAERSVTRVEERYAFPGVGQLAQFGVAAFFDAGKLWALDAPFGVTSPMTYSTGLSLLVAVPPRSRRLFRLDVAFPLDPDRTTGHVQFRFTTSTATSNFWIEPSDLSNGREKTVPATIFNYP
jgi:Omp85 superfamily domain